MTGEWSRLETALVCLRDPLSRIALAAGQLDELAIGSAISRSIQDAISEIDLRIEDTLESFRPELGAAQSPRDVGDTLSRLVDELRPALRARGIELRLALPDARAVCDASLLRRIVCRLLLGVGRWLKERAGSVTLTVVPKPHALGVSVDVHARDHALGAAPDEDWERHDILGPIRGFALSEALSLEERADLRAGHAAVTVWLDREAQR